MSQKTAISPTREQDFALWYQEVIKSSDLAEHAQVRGCMIIKPWGYGIWENIQSSLNHAFKATGHKNAYFPLLIPLSRLQKEADHVSGFAKECAVVTHSRLDTDQDGKLYPSSQLEEPMIIRPTSEAIIGESFAKWIQSYRDLPIKINQWANVMRWEMRTRLFLRTSEFLWQEGHTAHSSQQEAEDETLQMLSIYADFIENECAIPVYSGYKTKNERFPGAVETYCLEALMQDGKALQIATSHFLGQNFSKAFNMSFLDEKGKKQLAWTTSWGVSTRLIGGIIMTHSDDNGLVLPPRIATSHIVIMPLLAKAKDKQALLDYCQDLQSKLQNTLYHGRHLDVEIDNSDQRPGEKSWKWIKRGIPIRLEIGPRELEESNVFMGRRDLSPKDKKALNKDTFLETIPQILDDMQNNLLSKAKKFRDSNLIQLHSEQELYNHFKEQQGFVSFFWAEDDGVEETLKKELKITPRCILKPKQLGKCIFSGKEGPLTLFAKAY